MQPRFPHVHPMSRLARCWWNAAGWSGCMKEFLRRVLAFQSNGPDSPWHASLPIRRIKYSGRTCQDTMVELGARLDFEGLYSTDADANNSHTSGRPLQTTVDHCGPLQTTVDRCRPLQTIAKHCKPGPHKSFGGVSQEAQSPVLGNAPGAVPCPAQCRSSR